MYCVCHSAMLHFSFEMNTDLNALPHPEKRVALGVTGGIAAYKSIEVLRGLQRAGCEVRVAMTKHACEFIQPLTFRALSGSYVTVDDYAPDNPDPIAHITFSQTVDLFIIAPATANTLAKLANGVADDFLTSTYLACQAPVLIAPAMNTTMWEHPATQRNLQKLRDDGVHIIEPDKGEMACGTIGPGRLSEPEIIVATALELLAKGEVARAHNLDISDGRADLSAEYILITAGATREPIDPVRFISNRSSGRMGFALAEAARDRGAQVTVVSGITSVPSPAGIDIIHAATADEMKRAVMAQSNKATIFIAAAAVADYRPSKMSKTKIKKSADNLELKLERTEDILSEVAHSRHDGQIIVGFAAETNDLIKHAREKLAAKNVDVIVANDVSREGSGFDSEENTIVILLRDNPVPLELAQMSKLAAAHRVLDELAKLRRASSTSKTATVR